MNDLTDTHEGGAGDEAIAETPTVETNAEDTAAQDTGTDDAGQADDAGDEAPKPKQVPWFQKRIDELTAKRYDAEREVAYWRGIAEGRTAQQPQASVQQDGPPKEDQFDSFEEYELARIDYAVEQRLRAAREAEQRSTLLRSYEDRAARLREAKPDYDSVVHNPDLRITPVMADVIRESDLGPEVAYHLGTNPSEAARIASLPLHRQAAELGKLEAKLTVQQPSQPPQQRTPPPPPPKTVNGLSAGLAKDPNEMSMAEYVAARKAGQI